MTDASRQAIIPAMEPASDRTLERRISVAEYKDMVARLPGVTKRLPDTTRRLPDGSKAEGGKKAKRMTPAIKLPKPVRETGLMATLRRILDYKPLRNLKLAPEERIAVDFATELRRATLEGRLRAVWTHPANEIAGRRSGLSQIRYAIAKAMGLIYGTPDYLFLASHRSVALEAKVPGNTQQDNQKDFEFWCRCVGVEYRVFTSVEQGLEILIELGLLTRDMDKGRETLKAWERIGAGHA